MKLKIRLFPDGRSVCLHHPLLEACLGEAVSSVVRASRVEYNPDLRIWEVRRIGSGEILFKHKFRKACLDWEQENILDILNPDRPPVQETLHAAS